MMERRFSKVVKQAQEEGYTEPDPRLDLSGTDVMRKIMILAREAGNAIEMEDISNNSFLPGFLHERIRSGFLSEPWKRKKPILKNCMRQRPGEGKKLKFVASYENGKASVGLQHIDPAHDFYHLYGKDNIVFFIPTDIPNNHW